ncbi:hypothetical protein MPER_05526 [Moniliophthora perniciosa FA553]|nr:hypothetical protein MPER_05526 [Moniliophthora perniciosa FA553]
MANRLHTVCGSLDVCTKIMPECVVRCKIAIALVCETRKPSLTDRPEANWYFNTRSPGDRDLAARIVFESNPGMGNAWHGPSVYSSMCRQEVIKKGHYPVDYSVGSEPMDICVEVCSLFLTNV